jgi:hypothetical protein
MGNLDEEESLKLKALLPGRPFSVAVGQKRPVELIGSSGDLAMTLTPRLLHSGREWPSDKRRVVAQRGRSTRFALLMEKFGTVLFSVSPPFGHERFLCGISQRRPFPREKMWSGWRD